jgi:hypothetical protein
MEAGTIYEHGVGAVKEGASTVFNKKNPVIGKTFLLDRKKEVK